MDPYNTAKLGLDALMPIAVLMFGWWLNLRLKKFEQAQWRNQKLVEKKLSLYDDIVPKLNDLFCFYCFVGRWKDITPPMVVDTKRELDRKFNVYAGILGNELVSVYLGFMAIAFETYTSQGDDAKMRTQIEGIDGDRRIHCHYQWNVGWDGAFAHPASFNRTAFEYAYDRVIEAFGAAIGIPASKAC